MLNDGDGPRELSRLVVPQRGSLEATGDLFAPFRLVDADGSMARGPSARRCVVAGPVDHPWGLVSRVDHRRSTTTRGSGIPDRANLMEAPASDGYVGITGVTLRG